MICQISFIQVCCARISNVTFIKIFHFISWNLKKEDHFVWEMKLDEIANLHLDCVQHWGAPQHWKLIGDRKMKIFEKNQSDFSRPPNVVNDEYAKNFRYVKILYSKIYVKLLHFHEISVKSTSNDFGLLYNWELRELWSNFKYFFQIFFVKII